MKHRHNWKYLTGEKLQLSACECGVTKPMKRIKKECNCHCHNEFHWFINDKDSCAGITECPHCSPKPTEKNEHKCSKAYGNDCFYCGRDMTKPTKVEIKEIKTNPINEHTDINIVVIVNKLNEVIREINKLLSH